MEGRGEECIDKEKPIEKGEGGREKNIQIERKGGKW